MNHVFALCVSAAPLLQEARIVRVSDSQGMVFQTQHSEPQAKQWQNQEGQKWGVDASQVRGMATSAACLWA